MSYHFPSYAERLMATRPALAEAGPAQALSAGPPLTLGHSLSNIWCEHFALRGQSLPSGVFHECFYFLSLPHSQ